MKAFRARVVRPWRFWQRDDGRRGRCDEKVMEVVWVAVDDYGGGATERGTIPASCRRRGRSRWRCSDGWRWPRRLRHGEGERGG